MDIHIHIIILGHGDICPPPEGVRIIDRVVAYVHLCVVNPIEHMLLLLLVVRTEHKHKHFLTHGNFREDNNHHKEKPVCTRVSFSTLLPIRDFTLLGIHREEKQNACLLD